MKKDVTLAQKLILGTGVIIIIFVSACVIAIFNMNKLASLTAKMYRHPLTVSNSVLEIKGNIVAMHRSMKDVALAQNQDQMQMAVSKVDEYEKEIYQIFKVIYFSF